MCVVDPISGRLSQREPDFGIPGPIPLVQERHYRSSNIWLGDLGHGWCHSFGVRLWQHEGGLMFRGADGRRIPLAEPPRGKPSIQPMENVSLLFLSVEEIPWPALKANASPGVWLLRIAHRSTLVFDARPNNKVFAWRGIVDGNGNAAVITPNPDGLPSELTDSLGRTLFFKRDAEGFLTEIEIAEAGSRAARISLVRYQYDANRDLVAARDAAGARTYKYREHRMVDHQDRLGNACESKFDEQGRCTRTTGPGGVRARSYEYHPQNRTTSIADSLGNRAQLIYSENERVVQTVDRAGGVSRFEYDLQGRLVSATNQAGETTLLGYSGNGAQVAKMRPDRSTIGIVRNGEGHAIRLVSAAGVVTEHVRDGLGRVTATKPAGKGTSTIGYANDGAISQVTTPTGKTVELTWTDDRRTLTESAGGVVLTEQQFDLFGKQVGFKDASSATTKHRYDRAGHLVEIAYPDGTRRSFVSDSEGRLLEFRNELGHVTKWGYDSAGRRTSVTTPEGQTVRCEFDSESRLIAVHAPDGAVHRYHYDARGLVARQEFSDGRVEKYEYDSVGRLNRLIAPDGGVTEAEYDSVGLLALVKYPDGTVKRAAHNPDGEWMDVECAGHRIKREFDSEGRAAVEEQDDFILYREFDAAGQVAAVLDSLGRRISYTYDPDGRPVAIEQTLGVWTDGEWQPITSPRAHRFEYDAVGNWVVWTSPSGKVERRKYDSRGRMSEQSISLGDRLIIRRQYVRADNGKVRSMIDSRRGERRFEYDALGRLRAVDYGGGTRATYDYDAAGDLQCDDLQYFAGHRVKRIHGNAMAYDKNGFATRHGPDQLSYTPQGLLSEAKLANGSVVRFEYDPHTRLVRKSTPAGEVRYFWNEDRVWASRTGDAAPTFFLYLDEYVPFEQSDASAHYSIHTDALGTPQELIDDAGNIVWENRDGVWGEGRNAARDAVCPFSFAGQLWDEWTGLSYNRNRFYHPASAHYLTPDPVGLWGGLDAYRYVPDPVNLVDPLGLECRGKNDDTTLYRGDARPPSEICAQGFAPRNPAAGLTVAQHVEGVPPTGSNWISTTHDGDTAERFGNGYVYVIENPGCGVEVDCDPTLIAKYGTHPPGSEHEIAFNRAIPPGNVMGFWDPAVGPQSFQGCP